MRNPYEVLGVSSTDSKDVIKAKFRKLCKLYHPDMPNGDSSKFIEINEAWRFIDSNTTNKDRQYWGHKTLFTVERRILK